MKKSNIGFCEFCDSFGQGSYQKNFSYEGKQALYDYLTNSEEELGEEIELDTVALCCDFVEYACALDYAQSFSEFEFNEEDSEEEKEKKALEFLQDSTQVIEFEGGIIIENF